ncbi:MAG: phosphoribosyl-AMP cyclohydrolase [Rhodospirillales bacterium]
MPELNPADNDGTYPVPSDAAVSSFIETISFNGDGLVAAIAQQGESGEVLMMAWMSAEAVRETLATGRVCYWSRSRQALWRKGETSGQVQRLIDARIDCDGDTLLLIVDQTGVACHTGRRSCFFQAIRNDAVTAIADVEIPPEDLYRK